MDATIVIPTKNGGTRLKEVLDAVFSQDTQYEYEVICVDSGSTDGSVDVIRNSGAKLYEISSEEFGHGKTRNYGASKGTGEYILFLTQDALPANEKWLENFLNSMKQDPLIVGGFGRHLPYPDCNEIDKRDLIRMFDDFGLEDVVYQLEDPERYKNDEGYRHLLSFYSDNNSCMLRKIWEEYPYDDVDFAEDQIWARKMIEMGYKKLYCRNAVVYHSHNYPLKTYFARYYDEYRGLYHLHGYQMVKDKASMKQLIKALNANDVAYIKGNMDIVDKKYWISYAKKRNSYKVKAGFLAGMYDVLPELLKQHMDFQVSQQYQQRTGTVGKIQYNSENIKELLKWLIMDPGFFYAEKAKKLPKKEETNEAPGPVDTRADVIGFWSFIMDQEKVPFSMEDYEAARNGKYSINWVIPEMGVGSGGHIDIFRFVKYMQAMGFENRIYFLDHPTFKNDLQARAFMKKYYEMDDDNIEIHVDIDTMRFAHATVATSWITAYKVKNFDNTISKFYFVQDFEPLFYPVGSEYVFAENTYKLGFRGITAGDWLKDKLHEEYGMKTTSFHFSFDHDLYTPGEKRDDVQRIFFYARPVTARREFELGLLALNELTERMPDVEVVFAGWDVSNYKIDFKHKNLGSVKLTELSDLYAQCDVCLVLSGTNLSLLPLEAMASNTVVMCTDGPNSTWLINEENAVVVDADPVKIADRLEYCLRHPEFMDKKRKAGLEFAKTSSWDKEAIKVKEAFLEGIKEDEKNISFGR